MTKRRILEIEQYYHIDNLEDLEIWKRAYNIPPREMAPVVVEACGNRRLTAGAIPASADDGAINPKKEAKAKQIGGKKRN